MAKNNQGPLAARGKVTEATPDPLALAAKLQEEATQAEQVKADEAATAQAQATAEAAATEAAEKQAVVEGMDQTKPALVHGETVLAPAPLVPLDNQSVITELQGGNLEPEPVVAAPAVNPEPTRPPTIQARMTAHNNVSQARQDTPEVSTASTFQPPAEFESMMTKERTQGTPAAVALVLFMDRYVNDMAPRRPQSNESILNNQEALFFKIMEVIERSPSREFDRLWRILISYFGTYSTQCFSPRYMVRGSREWRRSAEDFDLFTRLMNLLHATATDRREDVGVNQTARTGLSEEGRGRLVSFYTK